MSEITQEKAKEYMEVSAILALDIELLKQVSKREMTKEMLLKHIDRLFNKMQEITTNKKVREERYKSLVMLNQMLGCEEDKG